MSLLSTLFDVMFPLSNTSNFDSATNLSGTGNDSNEMMSINPANGIPMLGGVGGIDLKGNLWGQSDSLDDQYSYCSEGSFSDLFDSSSISDTGSMLSCSMFD